MRTLLWLAACGSEQQIIDPNGECESGEIAQGTVTYELSCPEIPACPAVNLACPEVEIPACPDVEVTCPEPQITVEAPSVTVEPAEVNVTNDFADLVLAIEDLALNTGSYGVEYFAQTGYVTNGAYGTIYTNGANVPLILTSMLTQNSATQCRIVDASGGVILDELASVGLFVRPSSNCCGHTPSAFTQEIRIPINPTESLECQNSNGQTSYVLQGFYQ